jgi:1-deoxyxylulose-5-phosphate synthase
MANITRRQFIQRTAIGVAGTWAAGAHSAEKQVLKVKRVKLGASGLRVSKLAFGTGTRGWKSVSDQTRIGTDAFIELATQLYERGINFLDTADIYGSHTYVKAALKKIPRHKVVIMSKIWTQANEWLTPAPVPQTLDRFRKELGTDYIDLVLLHCMTSGDWPTRLQKLRDDLTVAREKGIVKAVGISCHNLDALKTASEDPWVQVILGRINNKGANMDDTPEKVMAVLKKAHDNGKGIIGMKIYGCGLITAAEEREASLKWVVQSGNVDCMTIGVTSLAQGEENIRLLNMYS